MLCSFQHQQHQAKPSCEYERQRHSFFIVSCRELAVDLIIAAHNSHGLCGFNRHLEALQVNLTHRALRNVIIHVTAVVFLIVDGEMLDGYTDARHGLHTLYNSGSSQACQCGILGIILKVAAAQRIAVNIHAGSQLEQKHRIHLSQELDMQQELFRKHKEQYEMAAENVELINRKCHDLKHQISALKFMLDESARKDYIRELERSVMIYDSEVKTGNEILDTILTEKSLVCEAKQIQLSCVADGEALSFMDAVDVYTIFGNAIDNAIESVSQLPDPGMRGISLLVTRKGDMGMIQTENYYESQSDLSEGLPSTTKQTEPGYHGFGLKSIRYTAEKYGGFMTIETANSIFLLRVVLPVTN